MHPPVYLDHSAFKRKVIVTIHINTPGGLIASLPPLMGFIPQECVVAVLFNSKGGIESIFRIDVAAGQEAYHHINGLLEKSESVHAMVVLVVGPNPTTQEFPMDYILEMYTAKLLAAPSGVMILAIPRYREGAPIMEVQQNRTLIHHGLLPDWKGTEVAAENILRGGHTVEDNELGVIANFLQTIPPQKDDYDGKDVKAWVRSTYDEGFRPSNHFIWQWLEESPEHRDWVIGQLPVDPGRAFSEFAAVARASGGKGREEALTIAGMAAYLRGKGAHAQVAFQLAQHEATERGDEAILAALANTMILNGLPPAEVKEMCQRIATKNQA